MRQFSRNNLTQKNQIPGVLAFMFGAFFGFIGIKGIAPALADITGTWTSPAYVQKRADVDDHCLPLVKAEQETIPASTIEIFKCDDPAFKTQRARIDRYIQEINKTYKAAGRPLYDPNISGYCAVVAATPSKYKTDQCNPSPALRQEPAVGIPILWNIKKTNAKDYPYQGDSYSPTSGYGAIGCLSKLPDGKLKVEGCLRWNILTGSKRSCDSFSLTRSKVCKTFIWTRAK